MSFASMGLSEAILTAISDQGYNTPTPIQLKGIPPIIQGKDVMAAAQTGTGKTAGFTLPILQRLSQGPRVKANHIRTLILAPTRELAIQIETQVKAYSAHLPLTSTVVYGGVKINPQMMRLRKGVDILVATPGRLLDLFQQNAVRFKQVEICVLDEADRMLDMGFIRDIQKILALLPQKRQNLLYSATFSKDIRQLAKSLLVTPTEITIAPHVTTAEAVKQWIHPVDKKRKSELLLELMAKGQWDQVLVFTRTKHGADRLVRFLEKYEVKAVAIHGNKSQGARVRALSSFKSGSARVLVATDIAARGIDIDKLPLVVNFDLPNVAEDYVHRIGRTGRAGSKGKAISLVSADEVNYLSGIEHLIKKLLPRKFIQGFVPEHTLPETRLNPKGQSKPKKKKKKPQPTVKAKVPSGSKTKKTPPKHKKAKRKTTPKAKIKPTTKAKAKTRKSRAG